MPVKIQSIKSAVADNGLKILVHGPAGAGKTVLSATTGVPTLILSAEAGLLSIKNAPSYIKTAVIQTLDDIEEIYEYLVETADSPDFKWVNLDSISEIAEVVLSYEKSKVKDPRKAYMELEDHMMKLLRKFRDLPGYNVMMTCKQKMIKDEYSQKSMYVPSLPGQRLTQGISYLFDEVFALRVELDDEKQNYRTLQTDTDSQYEAKDRSGLLDMFEKPSLKHIFDKIYPDKKESGEIKPKRSKMKKEDSEEYCEHGNLISNTGPDCPKCLEEECAPSSAAEDENVSKKDRYYYHSESDSVWMLPAGKKFPNNSDAESSEEITKLKYNRFLKSKRDVEEISE